MFDGCESLMSLDVSYFNTRLVVEFDNMFSHCSNLTSLYLSNFDTSLVKSMKYLFNGCKSLKYLNLSNFNTSLVTSIAYMFTDCESLTEINLENFVTSSIKSMEYLFANCSSLKNLSIENFDTKSVTNMKYMFNTCINLVSINLRNFNTHSVVYMNNMFQGCTNLENIEINNFDTSSVINMAYMFEGCTSLKSINLSNFVMNNLENMDNMFSNDIKLVYINLNNMFDYNIKYMRNILSGTQDNMVFCINESNAEKLFKQIEIKGCSSIDCGSNWIKSLQKIYVRIHQCIKGECASIKKYSYDYKCYDSCPFGTYPDNYVCDIKEEYIQNRTVCNIRNHFLKYECKEDLVYNDKLRKFIEGTMKALYSRELYDFALRAINDKEVFTIITENDVANVVIQIYALSNKIRQDNLTYIDFDECAKVLRKKHNYKPNDDIIVLRVEYTSIFYRIPINEYLLLNSIGAIPLHLEYCKDLRLKYYIPREIDDFKDYKNNTDVILYDRRYEFDINNRSLCESMCEFIGIVNNHIECRCKIKTKFNSFLNENSDKYNIIYRFNNKLPDFSFNVWVIKCFLTAFTKKNIISNKCGFIIVGVLFINILGALLFWLIGYKSFLKEIYITNELSNNNKILTDLKPQKKKSSKNIINSKEIEDAIIKSKKHFLNNKNRISFLSKINLSSSSSESKSSMNSFSSLRKSSSKEITFSPLIINKSNSKNILKYKDYLKDFLIKTDNELNFLYYQEALLFDKRNFFECYISLIRTHQLLVYSFNTKKNYTSLIIKICFFFFMSAISLIINLLFIDDATLHHIYINQGKYNFIFIITKIVYTSTISYLIEIILISIISTEDVFLDIKKGRNPKNENSIGISGIKFVAFFGAVIIILILFWIYVICFFGVFPKVQIIALEIYGMSFSSLLILPFIINTIPPIIRIYSLSKRKGGEYLYKFSQLIQYL